MAKAKKETDKATKRSFIKACQECGKRYKTYQAHSQFCPECRKHRAVMATLRNRAKNRQNLSEMSKLNTVDDTFKDIHLKVRRAVAMMEAGAAVTVALRKWLASCELPESVKNGNYEQLKTMLNCYSLQERGA